MGELYSVLFVCHSNLCRSPMAAALLRDLLARQGELPAWRIESAGTWARPGEPAAPQARAALQAWGLDLDGHRSRCVSRELLQEFNLILTMEQGQHEALGIEFPDLRSRVHLLSALLGQHWDLRDPLGGDLDDYVAVARQIRGVLVWGMDQLARLAQGAGPQVLEDRPS